MTLHTSTAPQNSHIPSESPAQVEDKAIQLHREMVSILREYVGMTDDLANAFAAPIVRGMRELYGGQTMGRKGSIYVPAPSKAERNASIRAEFIGTNADEICRKYGIGKTRMYEIVRSRG